MTELWSAASFRQELDHDADLPDESELIHWDHNDPENPYNFPTWKKSMICTLICLQTSWVTMCSSAAASIAHDMQEEFGVSSMVSRLPVAVFLFGMSVGPVILTPLAEDFGRKKVLTACLAVLCACFLYQNRTLPSYRNRVLHRYIPNTLRISP